MDYLKSLGSAAVSSIVQKSGLNLPFSLGEKVTSYSGKSLWSLHDGTAREDGSPVSIFVFDASAGNKRNLLPLAKNTLRKLRTIRHPDILKFKDGVEMDTTVYIMTERVQHLGKALQNWSSKGAKEKEDWLIWGLHRISVALAFINDSATSTHGNVCVDSIFISPSGEWKLGGFELLSNAKDDAAVLYTLGSLLPDANTYAPPEVKKGGWSTLKEHHPSVADSYSLGILLHSVFNPTHPLPATTNPPHSPPNASSRGAIPTYLFPMFKKLLNPNPKARLSPAAFLETGMSELQGESSGFFAHNGLVKVCMGLDNFNIASDGEKAGLLRTLKDSASSLPQEFASQKVLPSLVSALEFGGAPANTIIPLVLQMGANVPPSEYPTIVLAPILKLYASPDRSTRMALLDHLSEYSEKLSNKDVNDKVWPPLQTGFTDTMPVIREATVKAIALLYSKFSERILNNELLRNLARMQMDPEASIRTNTCILIGRLGPSLGYNTKRKVLVPAFGRALKDVFVHTRVAGLMSFMATIDCFDVEDMATKVIPSLSGALLDKERLVRDQAFKAMDLFLKKIEAHAAKMPETAMDDQGQPQAQVVAPTAFAGQGALVNSAAGAAGALAGWAMSSLSKKLISGEMQPPASTSTAASVDRPTSAPNLPSVSNGRHSPLINEPSTSSIGPGVTASTKANGTSTSHGKSMKLGSVRHEPNTATSAFLAELESEATAETLNAWGNDDLMDVNADEGDWSAFESAEAVVPKVVEPKPMSAHGLGFGEIITMQADDAWGDMDSTPSHVNGGTNGTHKAVAAKSHTLRSPSQAPRQLTSPRLSSSPNSALSPPSRGSTPSSPDFNRATSPTDDKSSAAHSMASMTKEEKAAEMARRREERKQRIAQLKEQKKHAGAK